MNSSTIEKTTRIWKFWLPSSFAITHNYKFNQAAVAPKKIALVIYTNGFIRKLILFLLQTFQFLLHCIFKNQRSQDKSLRNRISYWTAIQGRFKFLVTYNFTNKVIWFSCYLKIQVKFEDCSTCIPNRIFLVIRGKR